MRRKETKTKPKTPPKKSYNNGLRLKLTSKPIVNKREQHLKSMKEKMDRLQSEIDKPISNITPHDRYAQELIFLSIIASMVKNYTDANKADKVAEYKVILDDKMAKDEYLKQNLEEVKVFREEMKFIKVCEAKLKDPNLDQNDVITLRREIMTSSQKANESAQKISIVSGDSNDNEPPLTFNSTATYLTYMDIQEADLMAKAYRTDITNPEDLKAIYEASAQELRSVSSQQIDSSSALDLLSPKSFVQNELSKDAQALASKQKEPELKYGE